MMKKEVLIVECDELGQKVRIARMLRNWRQIDLAFAAHVTPIEVSFLERGYGVHPNAKTRILKALDLEETIDADEVGD